MQWNWQQPGWPNFVFDKEALAPQEQQFQQNAGRLLGAYKHLRPSDKDSLIVGLMG